MLAERLRSSAQSVTLPFGGMGKIISLEDVDTIAREQNIPGRIVEAEALRNAIYPTRYLRNQQSIPPEQQITLLESTVAQVGLGGLGGNLLELFLRIGLGNIRAADGDSFEESNLNRQVLSSRDNMGMPKTEAAAERGIAINPSVNLEIHNYFLNAQTLPPFLGGADLVIDALGGLTTRSTLQQAAADANVPLITGALAGWTGYISVVMPGATGPADFMGTDNGVEKKLGCPAPAVSFFASLMACEAIKLLTGHRAKEKPSILLVDLLNLSFDHVEF